jgi:hypothetical protein
MCYISSVAVVLTWSHDELTSNMADPLLTSAVNTLRSRMKGHLEGSPEAIKVIDLVQVTSAGPHHTRIAIQAMLLAGVRR